MGDPKIGMITGSWTLSGAEVKSPDHGSIISDFTLNASPGFTFSGRFRTTGSDDDILGFIIGYQDLGNHTRFAWDAFDVNSGWGDDTGTNGVPNWSGDYTDVHGVRVLQEISATNTFLFQDPGPNGARKWLRNTNYDFEVTVSGSSLSVVVDRVGVGNILNYSGTAGADLSGNVGLFAASQSPVYFSNLEYAVVPVPGAAVLGMIGISMVGAYTRKRRLSHVIQG